MTGYQPPSFRTPIDLDLSKNEGRPTVTAIDLDPVTVAELTSRYPDITSLTELIAERHGVPDDRVLVTAGGDDALFRCFLRTGGGVVATTPSFEMIRRYAEQVGLDLTEIPWWDEEFPVAGLIEAGADMAVIVSPNNPTGNVVSPADLQKVAGSVPLVVLDHAYAEFADEDLTDVALEMDNVVVVRTLSKAYGLAGLRVGYLVGPEDLVAELRSYGSPYSVSALSAALAAETVSRGPGLANAFVSVIRSERDRLTAALVELGAVPQPSQGNFVLATGVDAPWTVGAAAALGVALRWFPDREELKGCVRIGLPGDDADFERLLMTLRSVLAPQALLFDMDGVLAEVRQSFRAAIVETASSFGVMVSDEDIAAAKAAGNASDDWDLTRRLCAAAGVELTFEEVRDRFETIYQGDGEIEGLKMRESLIPDPSLLERWSRRLPLGIVTARPRKDAVEFLDRFDAAGYFETVVTREDAPSKPDPAPVRLALQRLGVERAWMFGDTRDDLMAARDAGVVPIGVTVPGDDRSALAMAARIVSSVDEIQEVLDGTKS